MHPNDATDDLLATIYNAGNYPRRAIAVSINPHPIALGFIQLVDQDGRIFAMMGFDLAVQLGWLEVPTQSP